MQSSYLPCLVSPVDSMMFFIASWALRRASRWLLSPLCSMLCMIWMSMFMHADCRITLHVSEDCDNARRIFAASASVWSFWLETTERTENTISSFIEKESLWLPSSGILGWSGLFLLLRIWTSLSLRWVWSIPASTGGRPGESMYGCCFLGATPDELLSSTWPAFFMEGRIGVEVDSSFSES